MGSSIGEEDDGFERSYADFKSFPRNLTVSSTHQATLIDFKRRLDEAEATLFKATEHGVVFFREYDALGRG
jgi:hypothetical protein